MANCENYDSMILDNVTCGVPIAKSFTQQATQPVQLTQASYPETQLKKKKWLWVVATIVIVAIIGGVTSGCGGSDSDTSATSAASSADSDVTPEFKATMDSYEVFFDEYIAFMQKYRDGGDPASMLADHTKYVQQYTDTMEEFKAVDQSSLSAVDAAYYTEVKARITKKLVDASL